MALFNLETVSFLLEKVHKENRMQKSLTWKSQGARFQDDPVDRFVGQPGHPIWTVSIEVVPPLPPPWTLCLNNHHVDMDSDEGINKDGSNDNSHRSSTDMESNMGSNRVGGNNMVQDRIAPQIDNNNLPPQEDYDIEG